MTDKEAHRQQIFQLVALREVDCLRAETQTLVEGVPRVLKARERASREAARALEAGQGKVQGYRARLKTLELDLADREAALTKANGNLLLAKTNQEYSLLQDEIGRKMRDKGDVETAILEQYETIQKGEQLVRGCEAALQEAQAEYGEYERRAGQELAEHQLSQEKLEERRGQVRQAIAADALTLYDRAYRAHEEAVVPIENGFCQGCFTPQTPNDRSRLQSGRELVCCGSCQRILFLPEVLQASSP